MTSCKLVKYTKTVWFWRSYLEIPKDNLPKILDLDKAEDRYRERNEYIVFFP